jgi:hypothetical protein
VSLEVGLTVKSFERCPVMTILATRDFPLSSSSGPLAHSGRSLMIALYISTQMRRENVAVITFLVARDYSFAILEANAPTELDGCGGNHIRRNTQANVLFGAGWRDLEAGFAQ